ncbi:MAG: hypothetical protein KA752_09455 [Giesbergeria sp.]|nr:hypothetical protein [Giesbergeria sp.]
MSFLEPALACGFKTMAIQAARRWHAMPWQWVRSSQEKQIASMTNAQMQNAAAGRIAPLPWKTGFHMQVGAKKALSYINSHPRAAPILMSFA